MMTKEQIDTAIEALQTAKASLSACTETAPAQPVVPPIPEGHKRFRMEDGEAQFYCDVFEKTRVDPWTRIAGLSNALEECCAIAYMHFMNLEPLTNANVAAEWRKYYLARKAKP